jgi:hypothetical protein
MDHPDETHQVEDRQDGTHQEEDHPEDHHHHHLADQAIMDPQEEATDHHTEPPHPTKEDHQYTMTQMMRKMKTPHTKKEKGNTSPPLGSK